MSRPIRFRAWRRDTKQMFDDIKFADFQGETIVHEQGLNEGIWVAQTTFFDFMQYTGLKDKNGKDCYEGDIVRFATYKGDEIGEVRFGFFETDGCSDCTGDDVAGWYVRTKTDDVALSEYGGFEIIGNVHESPELLGNKEI